tara:strand:- start:251 stop:394 length:144 start_codon:yes stop_codon:yes gene_type:complete
LKFIPRRLRITEDADDITQDVFLKASQSDWTEIVELDAWLFQIARNA